MRTKSKTTMQHRVHFTLELAIETPDINPKEFTELLRSMREEVNEAIDKYLINHTPNQELIALDEIGGSLNRVSIN